MPTFEHIPKSQLLRRGFLKGCGACAILAACAPKDDSEGFGVAGGNAAPNAQPSTEPTDDPTGDDTGSPPVDTADTSDTDTSDSSDDTNTPPEDAYEVYLGNYPSLFEPGGVEFFSNNGVMIAITRTGAGDSDFSIVSSICTHQGCTVNSDSSANTPTAGDNWFICPCHDARFDALGNVLSGPAPEALQSYSFVVMNNTIYVTDVY
ncbi:MAG: Rieske 2Fe-2S domain-containing protein [Myxococcota bacterium]|nr:Rieske 2Fe-2S domain-containing protein [Myxococcota bacterium]